LAVAASAVIARQRSLAASGMSVVQSIRRLTRSSLSSLQVGVLPDYVKALANARTATRLGTEYGGWVIPRDALRNDSICYCVGCGEDISFDLALIEKYSCTVYAFDPTPRAVAYVSQIARDIANYHFEPIAIWNKAGMTRFYVPRDQRNVSHSITNLQGSGEYIEVKTKRLSQIAQEHKHERISLLKLDIEGAERAVIETILEDKICVELLLVEFDELATASRERTSLLRELVGKLLGAGYELFWIERLNFTFVLRC
jgi:FkbM family methyltransferase